MQGRLAERNQLSMRPADRPHEELKHGHRVGSLTVLGSTGLAHNETQHISNQAVSPSAAPSLTGLL